MDTVFLHVLDVGITAGFVVLCVLLLRLFLRKAPKWLNVLLWGLVAVRLLVPFSFESVFSVVPDIHVPAPSQSETGETEQFVSYIDEETWEKYKETAESFGHEAVVKYAPDEVERGVFVTPTQLATAVWLAGVVGMTVYAAVSYLLLYRRVRTATKLDGNVFQSEAVGSPFVLGLFRPRIYLPYSLDGAHAESVLAHERAHIKRGDHLWKPLGFLLLSVYWFQPLLWVAYVLLCRDIELACDEKVVKTLSEEERRGYSLALVSSAVGRRRIAACPLAFGETAVGTRVKRVMSYKRPAFWIVMIAVVASIAAGVMLLTDRPAKTYGAPPTTLEGALLDVKRLDSSHHQTLELKKEDDGTYRRKKILDGTATPIYFYITDINEEDMVVTVGMNKPLVYNGETVSEVPVLCSRYTLLSQDVDGETQYYVLRMRMPTALENEPTEIGSEQSDRVVRRYVGDGYTLMLYNTYFRLVKGDLPTYNPQESIEADDVIIKELSSATVDKQLYVDLSAVFAENQAVGAYEFTDDGRLILTEDGGLTRYVFRVSKDKSEISHIKDELARHETALSPVLKKEKLTCEYVCSIDAHPLNVCDYVITDGKGEQVLAGESITKDLTLTSIGDGVLRVEVADRHSDYHKRTLQHIDMKTGECAQVFSHVISKNDDYIVHLTEEDGKVFVNADLSYRLFCGTPPLPQTLHIELEGLSSLKHTQVFGNLEDDELVVSYLDDSGQERVVARRLEESVMWDDDHQGEEIARPLIVVESEDPLSGEYCRREPDRTLYYGGVARVYLLVDGEYRDLAKLLDNREMTIAQFEEIVRADTESGKAEIVATYRDGGTWVATYQDADEMHTVTFRHTVRGDDDVYIGKAE